MTDEREECKENTYKEQLCVVCYSFWVYIIEYFVCGQNHSYKITQLLPGMIVGGIVVAIGCLY